ADLRAEATQWLLRERLPEWRMALVVSGELHSATEGLWHGVDPTHPLHNLPSAAPAGEGLVAVYRAVDRLVGKLTETFSDAALITFAMGGMGPNRSDVPSMALLPELLYRHAFMKPLLRESPAWTNIAGRLPMLRADENWSDSVRANIEVVRPTSQPNGRKSQRALIRGAARVLESMLRGDHCASDKNEKVPRNALRQRIDWMPASLYQPCWHEMRFFALPSFYDGRIRINLAGRERYGKVAPSAYEAVCDEAERLISDCRDSITGEPVVDSIERGA